MRQEPPLRILEFSLAPIASLGYIGASENVNILKSCNQRSHSRRYPQRTLSAFSLAPIAFLQHIGASHTHRSSSNLSEASHSLRVRLFSSRIFRSPLNFFAHCSRLAFPDLHSTFLAIQPFSSHIFMPLLHAHVQHRQVPRTEMPHHRLHRASLRSKQKPKSPPRQCGQIR